MNSANWMVSFWYQKKENVVYYFGLKRMNDSLLSENTKLRNQVAKYSEVDTLKDSTVFRQYVPSDSVHILHFAKYTYRQARVINNTLTSSINFLTINRGSKDGIRKDMAVISESGVVGKIVNVSNHFATAVSILNTKQRISAKLKDGTTSFVYWELKSGPQTLLMKVTQPEIKIKKGDSIYTTSYSTLFPADMLLGRVQKIMILKKDNSRILHIKPATNFENIQYVYVIQNDYIEERKSLEDTTIKQIQSTKPKS